MYFESRQNQQDLPIDGMWGVRIKVSQGRCGRLWPEKLPEGNKHYLSKGRLHRGQLGPTESK